MAYTCFLIGKESLLIECATILRQHAFHIQGIIATDESIRRFCQEIDVPYWPADQPLEAAFGNDPFDFLFSINNAYILPEAIVKRPRSYAINYHDGPLPAYAGVHATFWALVNQEKTHGITWHTIDVGIDTGAILKQSCFALDPLETSISLNVKCYSAAVAAFQELITDITTDSVVAYPQDLSQRTYLGRFKRPNTFLDWQRPASAGLALFRALDFGFHENPFGRLKLRLGDEIFLVTQLLSVDETTIVYPPGTLVCVSARGLRIATQHGLFDIRALTNLLGESIALDTLQQRCALAEGDVLSSPDKAFGQRYRQLDRQCARHQDFWLDKFSQLTIDPFLHPFHRQPVPTDSSSLTYVDVPIPVSVTESVATFGAEIAQRNQLLSAFLLMLATYFNKAAVPVGYSSPLSRQLAVDSHHVVADCRPLTLPVDWNGDWETNLVDLTLACQSLDQQGSFAWDWFVSQPTLTAQRQALQTHFFPVIICRSANKAGVPQHPKALTLLLTDEAACQLIYDPVVWPTSLVSDLAKRWLILLAKLLDAPAQPLKTIHLLTPEEQQKILIGWNNTTTVYPRENAIHQLVEEQVRQRPQAIAIRYGMTTLTYEQLNREANQLARHLQKWAVKPDTLVGVCLTRSPAVIVGLLAILKAGGAYVPFDPHYPAARLKELCEQTKVRLIITQRSWLSQLPDETIPVLIDEPGWLEEAVDDLNLAASAEHLAYVLFTSGSTGRPKSVAIPHRGVARLIKNTTVLRLDSTVSLLGLAPLAFDASTLEIWGSLANGGTLVLVDDPQPTVHRIKQTIQDHQVNTAFLTTALFNVLVDQGIHDLATLQQLVTGGEAASVEHFRRAQQQLPFCSLINGYGPTESTTFTTYHRVADPLTNVRSVPIGRPLSNTQVYLVDSFFRPVPVGVTGELLIGGDGLARGYLFEPALTAQQFIPDPFGGQPEKRLYRSGDLARYRPDGTIEFVGRLDDQLKIRGFRIEPGEIEYALCQHPAIREAVVIAVEPTPNHQVLVAYLVFRPNAPPITETIRAFLGSSLPEYLLPTKFIPVDTIPLKSNGKIDKSRLPPAFPASQNLPDESLTQTQAWLTPIWQATLKATTGGLDDNFFELGGSSLSAIQLLARIHQVVGHSLTLKQLFEQPTVRRLSAYLDRLHLTQPTPGLSPALAQAEKPADQTRRPLSAGSLLSDQPLPVVQAALVSIWQVTLNRSVVGLDDSFFEFGGSSLLAMQLLARIHLQLGWSLPMKALFDQPTVRGLSTYLNQQIRLDPTLPFTGESDEAGRFPLSFAQNGLWIIHQIDDLGGTYNIPINLRLTGPVHKRALKQSFAEMIRRHQPLRTVFGHRNGIPFQRLLAADVVLEQAWQERSLSTDALVDWLLTEAYKPFDLENGPLVRIYVVRLDTDLHQLLLVVHHLIFDGFSTPLFAHELSVLYRAARQAQPISLPPLPVQYTEYAQWQQDYFTPDRVQRERSYWTNQLAGAPQLLALPVDKPRPAQQSFRGATQPFTLPIDLQQPLQYGFHSIEVTPFLRLLSAFAVWVSQLTTPDVVIGIPVMGRTSRLDLTKSIGFFVNMLALRVKIDWDQTFHQSVAHVRHQALDAYDHQDLAFEQLVSGLVLPRVLAHDPLVQVVFDFQEEVADEWQLDGLLIEPVPIQSHTAKFDLHVSIRQTPTGLVGMVTYRTDLFTQQTISRLTTQFMATLQQVLTEPDKPIRELLTLTDEPYVTDATLHATTSPTSLPRSTPTPSGLTDLFKVVWSWVLNVNTVGLDDDFFALGGHPALAFQLTTELERQTGYALSIRDLLTFPTIRQLLAHLKATRPSSVWPSLVAVNQPTSERPLFLVHPVLGDIGYVYQLARYLPADQPLFGLRAVGLDGITEPLPSIAAIAAHYVRLLVEQQPSGSLALGGYSFGGTVAYEMAQQLKQMGREIHLLALIDSYPFRVSSPGSDHFSVKQQLTYYRYIWLSLPKRSVLDWLKLARKAWRAGRTQWIRLYQSIRRRTAAPPAEADTSLVSANKSAYSQYMFESYDGKLVFFQATREDASSLDDRRVQSFGWERYAQQGVDVHLLPGNHDDLVNTPTTLATIANVLMSYLR